MIQVAADDVVLDSYRKDSPPLKNVILNVVVIPRLGQGSCGSIIVKRPDTNVTETRGMKRKRLSSKSHPDLLTMPTWLMSLLKSFRDDCSNCAEFSVMWGCTFPTSFRRVIRCALCPTVTTLLGAFLNDWLMNRPTEHRRLGAISDEVFATCLGCLMNRAASPGSFGLGEHAHCVRCETALFYQITDSYVSGQFLGEEYLCNRCHSQFFMDYRSDSD